MGEGKKSASRGLASHYAGTHKRQETCIQASKDHEMVYTVLGSMTSGKSTPHPGPQNGSVVGLGSDDGRVK